MEDVRVAAANRTTSDTDVVKPDTEISTHPTSDIATSDLAIGTSDLATSDQFEEKENEFFTDQSLSERHKS
jgi:hypothetical protein